MPHDLISSFSKAGHVCFFNQRGGCFGTVEPVPLLLRHHGARSAEIANPKLINGDSSRLGNFRSDHPRGAQFVFGDGSVHFIHETISHFVLDSLATRNGGDDGGSYGG